MYKELIKARTPYHSSKFEGTAKEFFEKAKQAYKRIDKKGFLKILYIDDELFEGLIPKEALEKLEELYKNNQIPCKKK